MNDFLNLIKTRRSIRNYKQQEIPEEIINRIIEAGNDAPSGMNSQPWRFVVVRSSKIRNKMLETAIPNAKKILEGIKTTNPERYNLIMNRYEQLEDPIYYSAPVIIFVIGKGPYAASSCPLACQNIMLAAYSLGLGSCWVAFGSLVTDNDEIVKSLDLKNNEKIFGPILLGYPEVTPESPVKKPPEIKWLNNSHSSIIDKQ